MINQPCIIVQGSLTVDGSTVFLDSENLMVEDKNIIIGKTTNASDITADGGGITLMAGTNNDKTIIYNRLTSNWSLSEHVNIPQNKVYQIDNVEVFFIAIICF